jgi:hypothetical protein
MAYGHEDSMDHFPNYGSSRSRQDYSVSWGDVQDPATSHAADREKELAGVANEIAGLKGPDRSSSASTGFDFNRKQRRAFQREEDLEARNPPEDMYEEINWLVEEQQRMRKAKREKKLKEKEEGDPFDENYSTSEDERWKGHRNRDRDTDEDLCSSEPRIRASKRAHEETGDADVNKPHERKRPDLKIEGVTYKGNNAGGDPGSESEGQMENDFQVLKLNRFLSDPGEGGVLSGKKRNVEDYGTDSGTERHAEESIQSKGREKIRKEKKTRKTGTSPSSHAGAPIEATTSQEGQEMVEEDKVTQPLFQKGVRGQWGGVRENPTTTTIDPRTILTGSSHQPTQQTNHRRYTQVPPRSSHSRRSRPSQARGNLCSPTDSNRTLCLRP